MKSKLINKDGLEVMVGHRILTFKGELVEIEGWSISHNVSDTGRVKVRFADGEKREFFPELIGCKIIC